MAPTVTKMRHSFYFRRLLCIALASTLALASSARADNDPFAIYVMRTDGTQVRKLPTVDGFDDHSSARFSHDGQRVAFDASQGPRGGRTFFVVNFDGTGLRELGHDARPEWSPDDKQLAYDVYSPQGLQIHVRNLDGEGDDIIAKGVSPRFSPDGSKLAVTNHHWVRVVDLVTEEVIELFDKEFERVWAGFSWTPDGKRLALVVQRKPNGPRDLLLVDARGEQHGLRVRLTNDMGGFVAFSPDGKQLVFDNHFQIYLVDVEGNSAPKVIPHQTGRNKSPDWSADGKWIVFSSDR